MGCGLAIIFRWFGETSISLEIFLIVLLAAAMHAGWNAILKIRLEPLLAMALIHVLLSFLVFPVLFFTGLPMPESWPWLAASVTIHIGYYFILSEAYRLADMSQVYPIARGSAPLITTAASIAIFGEKIPTAALLGILILGFGIFLMSIKTGADAKSMDRKALFLALLTACTIALYTITDGTGARLSGNVLAYSCTLFFIEGIVFAVIVLAMRGRSAITPCLDFIWPSLAGAVLSGTAYGISIWAMTKAPIPLVASVRETSVLFATLIAVVVLKERLRANRVVAACLILTGLVLIRLQ
jgi:drug/metabolite transporter (DMT)-like permease